MASKDTVGRTIGVALVICIVCSILVSTAAVKLKGLQKENADLDIKKNLLLSAGILKNPKSSKDEILQAFEKFEPKIVNLETGEYVSDVDIATFDQVKYAKDPSTNMTIDSSKDIAKIKRRSKLAKVYLVKKNGQVSMVVLPVHGLGLWSTLYGFLALDKDTSTVKGFGFYQHGETPGLGGEVDNANWKAKWIGKKVYDENFGPVIKVVKGLVNPSHANAIYEVDGLAGATITSNGVTNLLRYWLGENGFGPYLSKFRAGGGI
ncbi:MAG: Na(+)-translocating NADH-quinone reductase subunit C [Epsilonproteobacteria bacterium]|nr:MAG: Na(+)-translocating NADH-quinone reductase subunit C [Campylobacterota bacterium]RLA67668.1 MAG: Na(+)-translocating NADH-quinone reductase subunit C [Campylobacterota bacterium]